MRTLLLAVWVLLSLASPLTAQNPAPKANPEDFGLTVPNAPPQPGAGRRVLVNSANVLMVGRVYVEVGDRFIVLLPNGRLMSAPKLETTLTDRPFEPVTKEQLTAELANEQFKGFKTRSTRRYIYIYNTSEPFYKATSTILETMYPALFDYCKRQKLPVEEPEVPLVAIMFRTQEEFDKYRPMPDGVVAYYNGVSNHVVMYEQSRLAEIAPDLAVKQSISTIAHEGVHQILHNIGVQQRLSDWPMWISEGLPEYFAPTQVDKGVRWKGVGLMNDLRQYSLQQMLKQPGAVQTPGALVEQTVRAKDLDADGYALSWALVHYLARQQQANFFAYLREVSKMQPLEDEPADNLVLFKKHFGSDLAELQASMLKNLSKLPYVDPIANQTHYVATFKSWRRFILMTTSPSMISKWRQKIPPAEYDRGTLQVRAFPNRATAQAYYSSAQFGGGWIQGP